VCCYGNDQNLIDSRVKEGGSLQRYHYLGGEDNIPYLTNFYYDLLPYLHCCRYGSSVDVGYKGLSVFSECQDYLRFRHVSSCYNYIPPRPGNNKRYCIKIHAIKIKWDCKISMTHKTLFKRKPIIMILKNRVMILILGCTWIFSWGEWGSAHENFGRFWL
jgi:hypothetical protein